MILRVVFTNTFIFHSKSDEKSLNHCSSKQHVDYLGVMAALMLMSDFRSWEAWKFAGRGGDTVASTGRKPKMFSISMNNCLKSATVKLNNCNLHSTDAAATAAV